MKKKGACLECPSMQGFEASEAYFLVEKNKKPGNFMLYLRNHEKDSFAYKYMNKAEALSFAAKIIDQVLQK